VRKRRARPGVFLSVVFAPQFQREVRRTYRLNARQRTTPRPLLASLWAGVDCAPPGAGVAPDNSEEDSHMELKAKLSLALAFALALGCGIASAQDTKATDTKATAKPMTPQQQRMVDCNKQATGKTGDERKMFMSTCLKGDSTAATPMTKQTQQEKMKSCNVEAKKEKLAGDARKTFMSTCLKGDDAAAAAH
jgi:psiF repeat-containing protein